MVIKSQPKKSKLPRVFDLGISWNWEYDSDFIPQINNTCLKKGLKPYLVNPHNLYETIRLISDKQIKFRYFFDRASDTDHRFLELEQLLHKKKISFLNHPDRIKWIDDKILVHMELLNSKITVPLTYIYYPTDSHTAISNKIKQVGVPFVVKPAHSVERGGMGVLVNAHTVEDIYHWRSRYRDFIFLLQRQVNPCLMGERTAWFRVYYVLGRIIPSWWDPLTHVYNVVTKDDIRDFKLKPLFDLTGRIAAIYKLGFFSTEIAVEKRRRFFVVDYINDQCDMRRKSRFVDGVSDETVDLIIEELVSRLYKIT
jgi:hypothetical protein